MRLTTNTMDNKGSREARFNPEFRSGKRSKKRARRRTRRGRR